LFSLTIEEILRLPDGTTLHGGHYSNLVKVGKYWIDPDSGVSRTLSDLFPSESNYGEEDDDGRTVEWTVSSIPTAYAVCVEMEKALAEISRACTETALLKNEKIDSYRCLSNYVSTYIRTKATMPPSPVADEASVPTPFTPETP